MAITNGYCTLDELKHRLMSDHPLAYTATTISFAAANGRIADTGNGLGRFQDGDVIRVSGSTSNDGDYDVVTGDTDGELIVEQSLTTEAAGQSVTITDISDLDDDEALENVVEAASRGIDVICHRRFYAVSETRTFRARTPHLCFVGDLLSVATLKTDSDGDRTYEDTWATDDYDLLPENASLDGEPYLRIAVAPQGSYRFPLHAKGVQIAGSFGYSSTTPPAIKEACLRYAARIWMLRNAVLGIKGSTRLGEITVRKVPPDETIINLLAGYRKGGALI